MAQPNSPTWVGEQFISKYYDVLEKLPKYLHRFYKEDSIFSVANVQPDGSSVVETATGNLDAIQDKVMATIANAVVAGDKSLDAQFSQGNGVILQVTGTLCLQGVNRKFVQAFFLATQEKGYYVLNDMLRIFPPEPVHDVRVLENGYVAPHMPVLAPGLAAQQLPVTPVLEVVPAMAPAVVVMPSQIMAPPAVSEPEPAAQESVAVAQMQVPAQVAAQVQVPAAVAQPAAAVAASSVPTPVEPVVPVPVPAPLPSSAPAKQAADPTPAAPAAVAPPPNLSWAERAKLASAAQSAAASTAKPPTPAKPPQPAPSPVPTAAPDASAELPAAAQSGPSADGDAGPGVTGGTVVDSAGLSAAIPVAIGPDGGFGVYIQGIPQNLSDAELEEVLTAQFSQFGTLCTTRDKPVNVVPSPRFGRVAYLFYQDEKSRNAARDASGKLRLVEGEKPVKVLDILPEFAGGFPVRGGGRGERGRGERGRGSSMGSGYRGGRGGFEGGRGRGGRGDGVRMERPLGGPGGRGGRGGERGGRGGGPGRGPRDASSSSSAPKQV